MASDGKHKIGCAWEVLSAFSVLGRDVIDIHDMRFFTQVGCAIYCSGETAIRMRGRGKVEFK